MTLETITAAGASIESQGTTIPSSSASTSNAAAAQVQDVLLGSLAWPGNHSFHKLVEADVSPENIVRAIRARGGRFFVFCGRCWTSLSEPLDVVRAYVDAAPERNKNSCSKPMKLDADHYLQQLYMTREFSRSTATSETLEEPNPSPILQAQLQASHATQDVPVAVPTSNSVSPTASSVQSTPSSTDKRTSPPSSSSVAPIVSTAAAAAALPAMPANYAHYASAAYPVLSYYSYFHQLNEATRKAAKLALPTVRDRLKTNTSGNGRPIKQTSKQTEKASSKSVKHGKPKKNPSMKVSRNGGPPASDVGPLPRGITARPSGKWQAQIYFLGASRYLGVFDSQEEAAVAFDTASEELASARAIATPETASKIFQQARQTALQEASRAVEASRAARAAEVAAEIKANFVE